MELLEKRGAKTSFHDTHVAVIPKLREHPNFSGRRSITLNLNVLKDFDAALIATDHDDIDYETLCAGAKLVIDTRNACARRGITSDNVVKA